MTSPKLTPCHTDEALQRYLREEWDEREADAFEAHLGTCAACQERLEHVAGEPELWNRLGQQLVRTPDGLPASEEEPDAVLHELRSLLAPTDDPEMLGRIGHYEVRGLIGRGSTGFVLKALEPQLNRYVAIKLLLPTYRGSATARKRFEREGRAVAAVVHEHVVPIHAVDEHRGLPYIVMQYVPGPSLQERIDRNGPLGTCETARVGLQVAQALAAAHAQGIVHRDVKPANVILEPGVERALVTDFGLARVADDAAMTRSGTIAGTPQFMSPEQARGDSIDARSDLFSLGSLMYTACTGRPPFRSETVFGVLHRLCEAEPRPVRELEPGVHEWLAALIARLMRKSPDERFDSAAQVAAVLSAELAHLQNPTAVREPARDWMVRDARGARRRTAAVVAGALAGAACLGWAFFGGGDDDSPAPEGALAGGAPAFFTASGEVRVGGAGTGAVTWLRHAGGDGGEPEFEQVWHRSFELAGGEGVALEVERGRVVVEPSAGRHATIEVRRRVRAQDQGAAGELLDRHRVSVARETGAPTLRASFGGALVEDGGLSGFREVQYLVRVPETSRLDLVSESGDVLVTSTACDLSLRTRGGNVVLRGISGVAKVVAEGGSVRLVGGSATLDVLTIHGPVHVAGVAGETRVRTSGADVRVEGSAGKLEVQTSGGSVEVVEMPGETLVSTSDGDIRVVLAQDPQGDAWLSAARGDVLIAVAGNVSAAIESHGRLSSAFPGAELKRGVGGAETWHLTELNGGGHTLRASSSSGEVRIAAPDPSWARRAGGVGSGGGSSPEGSGRGLGQSGGGSGSALGGSGRGSGGSLGGSTGSLGGSTGSLGGSGRGSGSSLGGSTGSLGGSGTGGLSVASLTPEALRKTRGEPRPGALVTVALDQPLGNLDGYTLYLPVSHDTHDGTYPVLVYLQGAYGVGGEIGDLNHWGLPRLLRDETDATTERNRLLLDGFIVVSPHIVDGQYHDHPAGIAAILAQVFERYKADPDRVTLTGLSRGGHGSWGLAERLPEAFAAIVPIGGSAESVRDFGLLEGTSVWIAHNTSDTVVPYGAAARAVVELQESCGVTFRVVDGLDVRGTDYLEHDHLLTKGRGMGHDAWTDLYTGTELYRWLLTRERPGARLTVLE